MRREEMLLLLFGAPPLGWGMEEEEGEEEEEGDALLEVPIMIERLPFCLVVGAGALMLLLLLFATAELGVLLLVEFLPMLLGEES